MTKFRTDINRHTWILEWPNGDGYTPVTKEYFDLMAEKDAILDNYDVEHGRTTADLTPDEYNRYFALDNQLMTMMAHGHVGKSVRY